MLSCSIGYLRSKLYVDQSGFVKGKKCGTRFSFPVPFLGLVNTQYLSGVPHLHRGWLPPNKSPLKYKGCYRVCCSLISSPQSRFFISSSVAPISSSLNFYEIILDILCTYFSDRTLYSCTFLATLPTYPSEYRLQYLLVNNMQCIDSSSAALPWFGCFPLWVVVSSTLWAASKWRVHRY